MNKERNRIIANNIRKYLKETEMTQKQLAELIDIKPSTLSDYLNLRSNPSHGVIQKIADVFGIVKSDIDTTYKEDNGITTVYNQLTPPRQQKVLTYAEDQLKDQKQEQAKQNQEVSPIRPVPKIKENYWDTTDDTKNKVVAFSTLDKDESYAEVPLLPHSYAAGTGGDVHEDIYEDDNITEYVLFPEMKTPYNASYCFKVNGDSMEGMFSDGQYAFVNTEVSVDPGEIGIFILNGEALLKKYEIIDDVQYLESINPNYEDIKITDNDKFKVIGKVVM